MNVVVSADAAADFKRLHAFLAERDPVAASRAVAVLTSAVQSLVELPERGRPSDLPNVRELIVPFGRSAYVLRYAYSASAEEVVVLRAWHAREERD